MEKTAMSVVSSQCRWKKRLSGQSSKDLKTIGQKHHIDGFRPGKVPAGLLKKMFGKQVLADVINRETVDALFKYIEDEKLSILGEPLAEDNQEVDFDKKDFTFKFEVGLAPAFELNVDKSITVPYYKSTLPTRWRSVRMRRSHVVSVRKFLGMKSTRQPLSRVLLLSSTKTAA